LNTCLGKIAFAIKPRAKQFPNFKLHYSELLEFGTWSLFGFWILALGAFFSVQGIKNHKSMNTAR
jgi:hypothetical protein